MSSRLGAGAAFAAAVLFALAVDWRLTALPVVGAAIIWWFRGRRARYRTQEAADLARMFEEACSGDGPPSLVRVVAALFRAMGHDAVVLDSPEGGSAHIMLMMDGEEIIVRCENRVGTASSESVREVAAQAKSGRYDQAWVVAPGGYTEEAAGLASSLDVLLFDERWVHTWLQRADASTARRNAADDPTEPPGTASAG